MKPPLLSRRQFLPLFLGSTFVSVPLACAKVSRSKTDDGSLLTQKNPGVKGFKVYDSLLYPQKPTNIGLEPIRLTGEGFWKGGDRSVPYEPACRETARKADSSRKFVIDIEHWPVDVRNAPQDHVKVTIDKILQAIAWMKSENPKLQIGVYGFPPMRDYWSPVSKNAGRIAQWQTANEFLRPIAKQADFLAPSIYTFYPDVEGWITYATANIAQAKRFGKPVLPVLWTRYHVSNRFLRHQFIPGSFWRQQLETVRSAADGVILWDWYADSKSKSKALDTTQEWWNETIAFVKKLQSVKK